MPGSTSGEWPWWRWGVTAGASSRRSPTSTWCCCTRRRRRRPTPACWPNGSGTRSGIPRSGSTTRSDRSGGARQIARTDLPAMLGMLDLRHIAGDPELAVTLHRRVLADWRADAKNRLQALRESCNERGDEIGRTGLRHHPRSQGIPGWVARSGGDAGRCRVLGRRLPAPGAGGSQVGIARRPRRGADPRRTIHRPATGPGPGRRRRTDGPGRP